MKKRISISILLVFLFTSILFLSACKDTGGISDIDKKVIPSSNVSYSEYIQPVFNAHCTNVGCHDDATRAAGLSLTSWGNATEDYLVVAPGNPDNSRLVWAIEANGAILMPPYDASVLPLNSNQIQGIKTWIKEGAKNN